MRIIGVLGAVVLFAAACSDDAATPGPAIEDPAAVGPNASAQEGDWDPALFPVTDEIRFEWVEGGCAGRQSSRLHSVSVVDGSVEWSVDTPWAPDGPALLGGDTVVLVDASPDSPSVAAYSLATGEGRWQRRLPGRQAELIAVSEDAVLIGVAWQAFAAPGVALVDVAGAVSEFDIPMGGVAHNDMGPAWWQSPYVIGPMGEAWDPFAVRPSALDSAAGGAYQAVVIGDSAVTVDDARVAYADRDTSWEATVPVDAEFSTVDDVRVGDRSVLILVGSDLGPNRRLVVLDRADGTTRWTLDGIREADVAGERVIYDRRTEVPDGVGPTRAVFLVDETDPQNVMWSSLAHSPLGGFLGTLNGVDHFVHQDPSVWPRAPYPEVGAVTEVQHFDPELLIVDEEGPPEQPMHGGERRQARAPGPGMAAGDGWSAVVIGELVWLTTDDGTVTVELGDVPRHLLATDTGLLATTGTPEVGCD